jgi:hypothetical protein
MPRDLREGPIVISLTGERAQRLADRLLSPRLDQGAERLLEEIAGLAGPAHRLSHDWDPSTGRLTLAASHG